MIIRIVIDVSFDISKSMMADAREGMTGDGSCSYI